MIIKETEYTMKNGRQVLIRSPREEDIQGILDYLYQTACETEFLLRYPEECSQYTPESEKVYLERINASATEAFLTALADGKVVGTAQIRWSTNLKLKHRASVGIALVKDYWNQGIGTVMMQEMIRIAEANPDILQVELDFIEGNARARALYEKMGFRITGIRPNAIRLKDGTLLNEYSMIRTRGERTERCPSGAFAKGESEVNESTETSNESAPRTRGDD